MLQINPRSFEFEGRIYDVRVMPLSVAGQPNSYIVKVFHGGELANGYQYSVSELQSLDVWNRTGVSMIEHLMHIAERDVREKVWEQFLNAVKTLEAEEERIAKR